MRQGAWVKDKIHGRIGYVVNLSQTQYCVQFVQNDNGTKSTAIGWLKMSELERLPQFSDEELHFLQILAVNTGDKAWFDELKQKRAVLKNGGTNES